MAKYSYTDNANGIRFDNLESNPIPGKAINGKLKYTQNDFSISGLEIMPVVNAVEIDWNGATLENADIENGGSKTINTTGDLLALINEMQKEIYVIGAAVIASAGT